MHAYTCPGGAFPVVKRPNLKVATSKENDEEEQRSGDLKAEAAATAGIFVEKGAGLFWKDGEELVALAGTG